MFGIQPSFFISGDDKTVTWLGFISSIILLSAVITVTVFYTIRFFRNVQSKIYINDIILEGPPTLNISNKNFVFMINENYPTSGRFYGMQSKIFNIKMHVIEAIPDPPEGNTPYSQDRLNQTIVPCNQLDLNIKGVEIPQDLIDTSRCLSLPETVQIGGAQSLGEPVYSIEIFLKACQVFSPGDCEVPVDGIPTTTINTNVVASEYFRDYSLDLYMIESSHDVSNFDNPISRNLKKLEFRFNSHKLTFHTNRLSQIRTLTSSGTFQA